MSLDIPEGMWELKSVVVLSNVQPYERGHPIYPKYVEELPYIPETSSKYMESLPIYSKYVGEPHDPQNVALTSNDSSYA